MCEACLEMDLYFSYLSEVEAKKQLEQQAAQPWQCEVTVIPHGEAPASSAAVKPSPEKTSFVCDEPE